MAYSKREKDLERKFYNNRMRLVSLGGDAPINLQIVARVSALAWEYKQTYKDDPRANSYYVSKKCYNNDLQRILVQENKLEQGGKHLKEAQEALLEIKEYLWLVAGSKVRDNKKPRVF